jgi:hypothetical protein
MGKKRYLLLAIYTKWHILEDNNGQRFQDLKVNGELAPFAKAGEVVYGATVIKKPFRSPVITSTYAEEGGIYNNLPIVAVEAIAEWLIGLRSSNAIITSAN